MRPRRLLRALAILAALTLAACSGGAGPAAAPERPANSVLGTGASGPTTAAITATAPRAAAPTAIPPTPTPTPVPEPRTYLTADGGWFAAETGLAVRDEPAGPRFWAEYQRLGGSAALGLPMSRPFDGPDGARVQLFQNGWLAGAAGQPGVRRGEGAPPQAPAEARGRDDRPAMAAIGRVDVWPRQVRQGNTVLLRIWSPTAQSVTATIEGRNLPLARDGEALVGLYAFHRQANLGQRPVRFAIVDGAGRRQVRNTPEDTITVVDAEYLTEDLIVTEDTLGILDPVKVNQEEALLNGLESKWTAEKLWRGPFIGPVGDVAITSDFGTKRSINGVLQNYMHEGTDFDVQVGDPVHAAADGRVMLSGLLHVRGNVVVIDHGWGVYTGYFHMFQRRVEVGQMVHQGDVVGLVGATGFVTGPHLHFEIRVQNVCVEPLEWLNLSPRERPDLAAL